MGLCQEGIQLCHGPALGGGGGACSSAASSAKLAAGWGGEKGGDDRRLGTCSMQPVKRGHSFEFAANMGL